MLARAETKERRQRKLERFFREAYALTFGLKCVEARTLLTTMMPFHYRHQALINARFLCFFFRPGEKRRKRSESAVTEDVLSVMRTALSRFLFDYFVKVVFLERVIKQSRIRLRLGHESRRRFRA